LPALERLVLAILAAFSLLSPFYTQLLVLFVILDARPVTFGHAALSYPFASGY
jgi:hypothetical protein